MADLCAQRLPLAPGTAHEWIVEPSHLPPWSSPCSHFCSTFATLTVLTPACWDTHFICKSPSQLPPMSAPSLLRSSFAFLLPTVFAQWLKLHTFCAISPIVASCQHLPRWITWWGLCTISACSTMQSFPCLRQAWGNSCSHDYGDGGWWWYGGGVATLVVLFCLWTFNLAMQQCIDGAFVCWKWCGQWRPVLRWEAKTLGMLTAISASLGILWILLWNYFGIIWYY